VFERAEKVIEPSVVPKPGDPDFRWKRVSWANPLLRAWQRILCNAGPGGKMRSSCVNLHSSSPQKGMHPYRQTSRPFSTVHRLPPPACGAAWACGVATWGAGEGGGLCVTGGGAVCVAIGRAGGAAWAGGDGVATWGAGGGLCVCVAGGGAGGVGVAT
jgi:hypothetical protein